MSVMTTSCIYRGNTFFGAFKVIGHGADAIVSLRYNGEELAAKTAGVPVETLAKALLERLVMHEAISIEVMAATEQAGRAAKA
jgi:hypothetical protein